MENDSYHNEILESAPDRFPVESFLEMRRAGLGTSEAMEMLGVKETDLSFQMRALLTIDPDDRDAVAQLVGYAV